MTLYTVDMTIYFASDHRGFALKNELVHYLSATHSVVDCGNTIHDPKDDHIDFIKVLAEKMAHDPDSLGIVLCGSGCGVAIGANRYTHLRATIGHNREQIIADCHEDLVNVLALGAEYITSESAKIFVDLFINTKRGEEERYLRRATKFAQLGTKVLLA